MVRLLSHCRDFTGYGVHEGRPGLQ
jgi:hypothetical protein